jgi:glucose/arabinose dehydrogenase
VATGLSETIAMTFGPDGKLYVCEKAGRIRVISGGVLQEEPFLTLDVHAVGSAGSNGLLGVTFDPQFVSNQHFYVHYTVKPTETTPAHNRISRFTASGDTADPATELVLLELHEIVTASNAVHYGGDLQFGVDGKLYVAVGDYDEDESAQLLTDFRGKILRLNPDGTIPADNPFFAEATGANRAIWALGLRNPFTFAFDPLTGRMFINDVGEATSEEINDGLAGANYGWPEAEGPGSNPQFQNPVHSYTHDEGCAVTAGAFFNPVSTPYPSAYVGRYFFVDFCEGWMRTLDPDNPATAASFAAGMAFPTDLEAGPDGHLYYIEWNGANVYRIDYAPPPPPPPPTTPFAGGPFAVPGLIQAEHFDEGAEGLAYHDTSPGNAGGQYRSTNVDIQGTSDAGGGHNIGWMIAGEWLLYTIDVAAAGTYVLEARVASPGAGGMFHVEANGINVTGPMTIPATGGWQTWASVWKAGVALTAGLQTLRIVLDTPGATGYVGNVNYVRFTSANTITFAGGPWPVPGLIQAEHFDEGGEGFAYHDTSPGNIGGVYRSTDVDLQPASDAGGGYNVRQIRAGEWLLYTIDVVQTGTYQLEARVAAHGPGGTFHVEIDDIDATGSMTIPNTGGWQSWRTITKGGLPLVAGRRTLRLVIEAAGATGLVGNVNHLRLANTTPFSAAPLVAPGVMQAENFDHGGEGFAYHDTTAGNSGGRYRSTDVDIQTTLDTGGGYHVSGIRAGEWLVYTIDVATTRSYTLHARVSSRGAGGTFHVEIDGVNVTGLLTVPDSGGWQTWRTVSKAGIPLVAGRHTVRLTFDTNGATGGVGNVNHLTWQ